MFVDKNRYSTNQYLNFLGEYTNSQI
uniref:Uncharacterized protein n=1 Tax=Anguilla anguilla TaxID=7936 RepID=A0A0E9Y2D4_ANGAN